MKDGDSALFPIGEVKARTGLTERRIRYYESLELLTPRRSEGNQRLYALKDIDRLNLIKELLESGVSLKSVKARLKQSYQETEPSERDAPSYFEGKRIAHGEGPRHGSLYPLKDRASILRRLEEDREEHK